MRGFREIRVREIREVKKEKKQEPDNYLKIKPETGMTVEEAQAFWDAFFASEIEEA
jgi:hypothetical protein